MNYKKLYLSILILFLNSFAENASLIVFSYNRPLQLYSFLESVKCYVNCLDSICVIYRADPDYKSAYKQVANVFPSVEFNRQKNPKADFKYLTVKAFDKAPSNYILFAVDDIIVKDFINIADCVEALKKTNAYGFFFRLGKSVNFCYMTNNFQGIPNLSLLDNDMFIWKFNSGMYDWNYPNNLDMTLYLKNKIRNMIYTLHYNSPNTLEGQWACRADLNQFGLCYGDSKIINLPMNITQNDCPGNRNNNSFTTNELLSLFQNGFKLDIRPFFKLQNNSAHINFTDIQFIARER
ncbi:hypothetical protein M1446_05295 [Candidatus Dependentiae bacterium]|nr:hypothetical protein [Candidatus Dependentiae bacterium]